MNYDGNGNAQDASQDIASALSALPAADVRPVVRGRWVHGEYGPYCSNCDGYPPTRKRSGHPGDTEFDYTRFCPRCGADMRETEPQKCEDCRHGAHWDGVVICGKDAQRHERSETCKGGK